MFSKIRGTIRNLVWEKAGVYLNEDIILPFCDKWACMAHQLKQVLRGNSEDYSRFLVGAHNVLSESFHNADVTSDHQQIVTQLEVFTRLSDMKRYHYNLANQELGNYVQV